ncbi:MAG TPA: hypothetical protein VGE64_03535 [Xanthomonadaceae bacterium]
MSNRDLIRVSLSRSADSFCRLVWPSIRSDPRVGGGSITPVEGVTNAGFSNELDQLAGIDAWQIMGNKLGVRGIASRVQYGADYANFTIRYGRSSGIETEYAKRLYAIRHPDLGLLMPHLTIQAFLDESGERLLSVAVMKTSELILQAERLLSWGKMNDRSDKRFGRIVMQDGTSFLYLSWEYLRNSQVRDHLVIPELQG